MLRISKLDKEVNETKEKLFFGQISPSQFMLEMSGLVKARKMSEVEAFDFAERCIKVYEETKAQVGSWKDSFPVYERKY